MEIIELIIELAEKHTHNYTEGYYDNDEYLELKQLGIDYLGVFIANPFRSKDYQRVYSLDEANHYYGHLPVSIYINNILIYQKDIEQVFNLHK